MNNVRSIASVADPRIRVVCEESFPGSPAFATYLANRIHGLQGSVKLARIFCESLHECCTSPPPYVSSECVERLSVENNHEAIGRMNTANPDPPLTVGINTLVLLSRAGGTIKVPRRAKNIDDLLVVRHKSVDASREKKDAYCRLFYCAYAMLVGVTIDPRIDEAA